MQTIIKISIFFSIIVGLLSCESNLDSMAINEDEPIITKTRSASSFDNCINCVLPSNVEVRLPWTDGTQTTIPDDIRKDVKESDGWIILDATVEFVGHSFIPTKADSGCNYILLYNTYSGVLKGFYYAENMNVNNCGFFQLTTSIPSKLFNFYSNFAIAADEFGPQSINLSAVTSNGITKGFEKGWNCFMIELAYDPNSYNQRLDLSGFAMNNATITQKGAYNSSTTGTIVTSAGSSTSNLIKGVVSGIGEAGKQWIKDNIGDQNSTNPIKYLGTISAAIWGNGISGIIGTGIYKVFSSVLGNSSTSYDVNFKTTGNISISGQINYPASSYIHPIAGLKLGRQDLNLGIWNLSKKPVIKTNAHGEFINMGNSNNIQYFEYMVRQEYGNIEITSNPNNFMLQPEISNVVYEKFQGSTPYDYELIGKNCQNCNTPNYLRKDYRTEILYQDSITKIVQDTRPLEFYVVSGLKPSYKKDPNKPIGDLRQTTTSFTKPEILVVLCKQSVYVEGEYKLIYSSKSFVPNRIYFDKGGARPYGWTINELSNLGF